ncbi:MAG TPA: enoyl-CoA hydratase/isomerase family protein [Dehalococcoidia bacterium]|jgi:enoyl-CoA hydratase/carnithine racemase|nr:enoyl-CoA hydratase/isomerase family protein [Dehalococcoidia bacterium]
MTIDFVVEDKIATITLNRPEALNAMTPEMYAQLSESWIEVRDNPDIWVAVVAAAPQPARPPEKQVFSAGADLKRTIPRTAEPYSFWQTQSAQILNRGLEVWKPVVAAIDGLCLAGGMTLLLATDIRVAGEHSMFDLSEVKRGILPGNGGTQRTIRQLPYPIAMEVLLLGKRLSAERAAQFGLINEVVPYGTALEVAQERARELRAMPPLAVRAIKELSVRAQYMPLADGLRMESAIASTLSRTEDAKEGPLAFAEKRNPEFHGR